MRLRTAEPRGSLGARGVLAAAALLLAAAALPGCAAGTPSSQGRAAEAYDPPRRRLEGPRTIPFAGGDPAAKGWVQVDGLLWVERERADALSKGLLWTGERYETFAEADAVERAPDEGYALRTDHVLLRTNVPFRRARDLARLAERHVQAVLAVFGDALDLRLPADPLRVVVAARREEYARLLRERVSAEVAWNSFYEAADGTVYACDERSEKGGLSVVADLRHEMTHAVLDLGRDDAGRAALFGRPQFWAWEGAAVWAEGLSDPPDAREGAERIARFQRRRAWGETTPLAELFALRQQEFSGRHYDEAASFMGWLMDEGGGRRRAGFLALLAQVMGGWGEVDSFERAVGLSPAAAEASWLASLDAARR